MFRSFEPDEENPVYGRADVLGRHTELHTQKHATLAPNEQLRGMIYARSMRNVRRVLGKSPALLSRMVCRPGSESHEALGARESRQRTLDC